MKTKLAVLLYLFLVASCSNRQEQNPFNHFTPKVVKANAYIVSKDSIAEPKIIPVDETKLVKVVAGKPVILSANNNVHRITRSPEVLAAIPRICIPGKDSFLLPTIVTAIDSPFIAGIPEITIAKDAYVRERNPQSFSSFNRLQGLKHSQVRCLLQDKAGNLWFGTYGAGVSKYDGRSFTHFTESEGLTDNTIYSIMEDKEQNIWIGTHIGAVKYNGKTFTRYRQKEGLSDSRIYDIFQDRQGNIWFGTEGEGVYRYDGRSFTHFTEKQGLSNNTVYCILQDLDGNIWLATEEGGVSVYDGKSFRIFSEKEGLSDNMIISMLEDRHGNIWLATGQKGVCKYDGKSFTHFTEKEGLSFNNTLSLLEDRNGDIWIGTDGKGISKYNDSSFVHFGEAEGLNSDIVLDMLQDRSGNIWFATFGGGLSKYDGKLFTHLTEKEGLANSKVWAILNDRAGNLWFGTYGGGLSKYDGNSFTQFTEKEGLKSNRISALCQDRNGNIWLGTIGEGISRYDGKSFTHFTEKDGLCDNTVYCITEDKAGNLWFGTKTGGVSKYDGKSFIHFTEREGLSSNKVMSILQDQKGDIWIATYNNGVTRYDGKSFTYYTEQEGLSSNTVLNLLLDRKGNLWFGTRSGLNKITAANLMRLSSRSGASTAMNTDSLTGKNSRQEDVFFKSYTYEDGFLGMNCIRNSVCEDKTGTIWFGTTDRLTAYHPAGDESDTLAPDIQLTSVELFNERIDWAGLKNKKNNSLVLSNGAVIDKFKFEGLSRWYNLPEKLSLAHNNNYITFNFIGITQKQNKKIKYQYILEGADENWSAVTDRTQATYSTLPPGRYTFKVKAMNSEGYGGNEIDYAFRIRPPWWKTWWAYTLYILTITCSIIYYIKWREKLLRRQQQELAAQQIKQQKLKTEITLQTQEKERNELGRELHDNINQILATAKMFLGIAKTKDTVPKHLVEQSFEYVDDAIEEIRKLSHTLVAPSLGEIGLKQALQQLVEDTRLFNELEVELSVDETFNKNGIDKNKELMLYRVVQEQLNNVLKYAHAKRIEIRLTAGGGNLVLSVSDNGVGFDTTQKGKGIGLRNISNRVEFYSGKMNIHSAPGHGCTLEVQVPF